MTGFKPLSKHFSRQKSSAHFGKTAKRGSVSENLLLGSLFPRLPGDSIACNPYRLRYWNVDILCFLENTIKLHAIHTACGIETGATRHISRWRDNCMQSIPLAVLKLPHFLIQLFVVCIACNPYRLRYWNFASHARTNFRHLLHAIHTACGIETPIIIELFIKHLSIACNPYRLRYWNSSQRESTSFLTALHAIHTACGIETALRAPWQEQCALIACNPYRLRYWNQTLLRIRFHRHNCMQSIPLAVLKLFFFAVIIALCIYCMQSIPLAVLKHDAEDWAETPYDCMQSIPLAVLKQRTASRARLMHEELHAIHTACGIETKNDLSSLQSFLIACNPYRLGCVKSFV